MEALISGEFLKCRQTFHLKVFPFRQEFELECEESTKNKLSHNGQKRTNFDSRKHGRRCMEMTEMTVLHGFASCERRLYAPQSLCL